MISTADGAERSGEEDPGYSPFYQWYVVTVLMVMMLFSWLDRKIIVLLIDPIKRDLGITEVQVSLLTGFAFAIVYSVCLLPLGWAADRYSRRWIIACGVFFWSVATVVCGLARGFTQLFIGRLGVGAGESTLAPSAFSLLADVFPPKKLAFATAVMSTGSAIGMGLSFVVGGAIAAYVSDGQMTDLPFFGEVKSWQVAFIVVGLPGPLLALWALTIGEPRRRGSLKKKENVDAVSWRQFLAFLRANWQFYACCMGGCALLGIGIHAAQTWSPPYMSRVFGWSASQVGGTFGPVLAGSFLLSFLLGGKVADYFQTRGVKGAHLRIYAIASIIVMPIALGIIAVHNAWIFLVGVFVWQVIVSGSTPVCVTGMQIVTPSEYRGRVVALFLFTTALVGQGGGPLFVAMLTQYFFKSDNMVGWSLAITVTMIYPVAAFLLWKGSHYMRRMQEAQRET